jgi:SAM-dependent methyltransferase
VSDIYRDGTYLQQHPTWYAEDSPWKAQKISEIIGRNDLRPSTICEVGCGAGEVLNQLSLLLGGDIQYYGYEISEQAYSLCVQRGREGLHFHHADLLAEETAFFEIVLAIDVFEHVEDYIGFLKKLREKGRYKIFHIPLDISVQSVMRATPLMKSRQSAGHLHYFTKLTALATLRDAGYQIKDQFYTSGSTELSHRGFKAALLKMPRKLLFSLNQDFAVRLFGGFSLMVLAE